MHVSMFYGLGVPFSKMRGNAREREKRELHVPYRDPSRPSNFRRHNSALVTENASVVRNLKLSYGFALRSFFGPNIHRGKEGKESLDHLESHQFPAHWMCYVREMLFQRASSAISTRLEFSESVLTRLSQTIILHLISFTGSAQLPLFDPLSSPRDQESMVRARWACSAVSAGSGPPFSKKRAGALLVSFDLQTMRPRDGGVTVGCRPRCTNNRP